MSISRKINKDFFKHWSPEMAYVLGFFTADGNMSPHSNGGRYLEFTSKDLDVLEKIKRVMMLDNKISTRMRDSKQSYRIQVSSSVIFNDLLRLGLTPKKSKTITLPSVPQKFFGDFLRGYFDGDGSVNLGKYWVKDRQQWKWVFSVRFTSGSKLFLQQLWTGLRKFCKGGYLYNKNRGYELVFSQKDGIELFRKMYHNKASSLLCLERKYNKFLEVQKVINWTGRSTG